MGILTKILNRFSSTLIYEAEVDGKTEAIRLGMVVKMALKVNTNLQKANLRYANLQEANLQGANLRYANLQEANLQGANLQEANLQGANLQGAYLQGAYLQGANLDFSSGISFKCTSFGFKCDFRLVSQILCHVARLKSDDPEASAIIAEIGQRWGNEFCKFRDDVKRLEVQTDPIPEVAAKCHEEG